MGDAPLPLKLAASLMVGIAVVAGLALLGLAIEWAGQALSYEVRFALFLVLMASLVAYVFLFQDG